MPAVMFLFRGFTLKDLGVRTMIGINVCGELVVVKKEGVLANSNHDSIKLLVGHGPVNLERIEFHGAVFNGELFTIKRLPKGGTNCILTCVSGDLERFTFVKRM